MTPHRIAPLVAALLFALPAIVHAQATAPPAANRGLTAGPTAADPEAEARRLFEEGTKAFEAGDFARAEQAFEGAFATRPTFDSAVNLGIAESKQSKFREAAEHFDYATRNFPPSESAENRERLGKLLAEAKSHVASLRVEVSVPGATVTVQGVEVGRAPLAGEAFADPGKCAVVVRAEGYEPETLELDVQAGLSKVVTVRLREAEAASAGRPSWPGWVMGGVGLATVGVGAALLGIGQGKVGEAEDIGAAISAQGGSCDPVAGPGSERCAEGQDALDGGDGLSTGGVIALGVGGALLLGGVLYLVIPDAAPEPSATAMGVVPFFTPNGGGLVLRGGF